MDVLAIDRDGVGDPLVVEIKAAAKDALAAIPQLLRINAPYRWIAFLQETEDTETTQALASQDVLFPPSKAEAGRIGVIAIVRLAGGDLGANVRIRAERFATTVYDLAMQFSGSHKANIQFGE